MKKVNVKMAYINNKKEAYFQREEHYAMPLEEWKKNIEEIAKRTSSSVGYEQIVIEVEDDYNT